MGAAAKKDPNVDLYIDLQKQFYYAGEWVEGVIYVNAKTDIQYTALYLHLEGHEYCHWSEGGGKHRRSYTGSKQIYKNENIVSRFDQGLKAGNYAFPFSIQLSPDLVGSFIRGANTMQTIYYPIKAMLLDYSNKNQTQQYAYNITIIEPMRKPITPLSGRSSTNPSSCCCIAKGQATMTAHFSTNAGKGGDRVIVRVQVDNSQCKAKVQNVMVVFANHTYKTSNSGAFRTSSTSLSNQPTRSVEAGQRDTSQVEVILPNVTSATAFGSLVGNYYTIEARQKLEGCYCCCGDDLPIVTAQIHMDALTPEIHLKPVVQAPLNWNPIYANKVIFNTPSTVVNFTQNPNIRQMNRTHL